MSTQIVEHRARTQPSTPSKPDVLIQNAQPMIEAMPARLQPHRLEGTIESERAEILRRVNAFRTHQVKIGKEREEYYNATLARTRAVLGSNTRRNPL
jgi:hypothetical protein